MSLQESDRAAAAVAVAPRVALADIEAAIAGTIYATGAEAFGASPHEPLSILTLCAVTMKNGFTVIGKSAPASVMNFNRDLGRKFAYEDAVRQIWPLMGFALRDKLHNG
jgi:hypothetical protein